MSHKNIPTFPVNLKYLSERNNKASAWRLDIHAIYRQKFRGCKLAEIFQTMNGYEHLGKDTEVRENANKLQLTDETDQKKIYLTVSVQRFFNPLTTNVPLIKKPVN